MLALLYCVFYTTLAPLVFALPAASPAAPGVIQRVDVSFTCDCTDHWFKHGRVWIRASSTSGCMALETIPKYIYALNALLKPDYRSNDYPNLICSLNQNKCQWTYSPLDFLGNSTSSGAYTQQSEPPCEKLDDGARDLLPPILPIAEGPSTLEELKLEASLSVKHPRYVPEIPEDEAGKDDDSGSDDGEDSDSEEEEDGGD